MNAIIETLRTEAGNVRAAYNLKENGGPVICFIHGAGGSFEQYMNVAERINDVCSFVALDLPGHGKSDAGELSIENYAESVISVMKKLAVTSFVPVGHSMGGGIVLEILRKAADMVKGMIFISTGSEIRVNDAVFKMIENDFTGFADFAAKFSFSEEADENICAFMSQAFISAGKDTVYRDFQMCNTYNYTSMLESIDIPVLVLAGKKDKMIPASVSEKLSSGIKNSKLIIYDYNGHMPHCEMPERVAKDIMSFAAEIN